MNRIVLFLAGLAAPASGQIDWTVRDSGAAAQIRGVAFGNGVFVAIDERPLLSADGVVWTRPVWTGSGEMLSVHFTGDRFIALGYGVLWVSPDGLTGARYPLGLDSSTQTRSATLNGVTVFSRMIGSTTGANVPGRLLAGSTTITASTGFPSVERIEWIVSTASEFLAGTSNAIFASTDGLAWRIRYRGSNAFPVSKNGVLYSAFGMSSDNGATWLNSQTARPQEIYAAGFFVRRENDRIQTSPDALQWTLRESGTTDFLNALTFGNNTFVAVGYGGRITTSSALNPLPAVAAPGLAVVPSITLKWPSLQGRWYQVQSSPDMATWTNTADLLPGSGTEMSRSYESTAARRYYRVLVR
jgi:hypothetical protein